MFAIPVCILKLNGYKIITVHITKQTVCKYILKYSCCTVNWFDTAKGPKMTTKFATYKDFEMEYHHLGISYLATDAISPISSIQPTFELDLESPTFTFVQKTLHTLRANSLLTLENNQKTLENFKTSQKTPHFMLPTTLKSLTGDESIISKTVKEKEKFLVLFYRLLLSARCTDILSNQVEITLGNLSESFLTALNTSGHFEGLRIFSNAFSTYRKEHL